MTLEETLQALEALGDAKVKAQNAKNGVSGDHYGVKLGELRKLAKKIRTNHALALQLWQTGNFDARMLAILLMKPAALRAAELDALVRSLQHPREADWLNAYIVKQHPDHEILRQQWLQDLHPMAARAGWSLTAQAVVRQPERLDLAALLTRIAQEMAAAAPEVQWTMNMTLAEIGIHHPVHRQRALEIGEALGIYRDYPVSKGCTSPFAPIWIREMVQRQA